MAEQSLPEYQEAAAKGVTAKVFKSKNKAMRSAKGTVGIDAYATTPRHSRAR